MFPRLAGLLPVLLLAVSAPAADPITLTAEATEVVRLKPDQAKVYLSIESKEGNPDDAATAGDDTRKKLTEGIDKLGLKSVKVAAAQLKVTKDRDNSINRVLRVGPNGAVPPAPPDTYTVVHPLVVTVSDADPDRLLRAVERVIQTAASAGVTGERTTEFRSSPYGETRSGGRVVYGVKGGWDAAMEPALTKATERALKNAQALAKGVGATVQKVEAVEDLTQGGTVTQAVNSFDAALPVALDDELIDGELVRKVRVRVKVIAVVK
jgi:uncharacterized protein YggE